MASHKSAAKKARQDERRRRRNRLWRSRLRTQMKSLRQAATAGDREQVQALLPKTLALVDRTARGGVIHDNTAARYKSRLHAAANKLLAD